MTNKVIIFGGALGYNLTLTYFDVYEIENRIKKDDVFSQDVLKQLSMFIDSAPRNKLVLVKDPNILKELQSINVGFELSRFIHDGNPTDIKAESLGFIRHHIAERTQIHPIIGKYVSLTNIGILFEPAIGIDMNIFLSNLTRNTMLILEWKGEIKYPHLFFLHSGHGPKINISQLSYITL